MAKVAVSYEEREPGLEARARALATDLGLEVVRGQAAGEREMLVVVRREGVQLVALRGRGATPGSRPFHVRLDRLDATSGPGRSRKQPLARALGLGKTGEPGPSVLDATAGWGEDAWLMAMLGCRVLAVERSSAVAALLLDGLQRLAARRPPASLRTEAQRLMVMCGDARQIELLPWRYGEFLRPDVVYLDPMFSFAERGRRATERRPLVLLRQLVGDDADAGELLEWALARARRRVVVKRPLRGPLLAGREPVASHRGKSLRWDVYRGSAQPGVDGA